MYSTATGSLRGNRLQRVGAVGANDRVLEQDVLGGLQARIGVEDRAGVVAGALEQLGVVREAGEAVELHAGLADADHLALAAQLEVDLRQPEAVAMLG